MPERINLFTSNDALDNLSRVLYTYEKHDMYMGNLISYIEVGLGLGQDVLLVETKEKYTALSNELFSELTEDQVNRIHHINTFESPTEGFFDRIADTAKQISKSHLLENDIRSWLHVNEERGSKELNVQELSSGTDLDKYKMLCVHAHNGGVLSATQENRLLEVCEYFMTDATLVRSPLYKLQADTSDAVLPYIDTQINLQAAVEFHKKKDNYVQVLAHELRNPITVIRGYASLLLASDLSRNTPDHEKLQTIVDYTDVIEEEIQNILHTERVLSGNPIWESMIINPSGIIQRTLQIMRNKAKFRDIAVDSHLSLSGEELIYANETDLRLIMSNIVSNAIKYSDEEESIEVHVTAEHGFLRLWVEDHGVGMTEEQVSSLFRRYGKMNHDTEGHGIGMFAVKSIVERLNGTICVDSQIHVGTKVTVYLPMKRNDVHDQLQ